MRTRLLLGAVAAAAATTLVPQPASAFHQWIACSPEAQAVCDVLFFVEGRLCSDPLACTTG